MKIFIIGILTGILTWCIIPLVVTDWYVSRGGTGQVAATVRAGWGWTYLIFILIGECIGLVLNLGLVLALDAARNQRQKKLLTYALLFSLFGLPLLATLWCLQ